MTLYHILLMVEGLNICIQLSTSDTAAVARIRLKTILDCNCFFLSGSFLRWGFLIWELIFYLLQTFCPHLGIFFFVCVCVVSSFTTFRPNFTSGLLQVILPWPRIGMMSLVTVFPVITAFHSCCLSHHVFDQVNLWLAWVGFETAIFWQCSSGTVETQRLYLLRQGPRRAIKDWLFVLINPYLVFYSRVHTEFL